MRFVTVLSGLALIVLASCGEHSRAQEPPKKADPFDTIPDVERRKVAQRLNELLDPIAKKEAGHSAGEYITELDARVRSYLALSQYRLEYKDPKAERQLIALVDRMKAFKPSGSALRYSSQPEVLKLARKLLEEEQRAGKSINRDARLALAKTPELRLHSFRQQIYQPDISEKLLRLELTAGDLLPCLFHLDDCRRDIEWLRAEDRKLYALIQTFPSDKDRFELVRASQLLNLFNLDEAFIRKDKELSALHDREAEKSYVSDEFQAVVKKRVYPVFTEQARRYQRGIAEWFSANDQAAIESLLAVEALQDEYHRYVLAVVPDFKYKLKPVVPKGEDGKPLLEPLKALTFDFDFADYVTFETRQMSERYGPGILHTARVRPLR